MKVYKKILISVLTAIILIVFLAYGLFLISKSRNFQFFGIIIERIETDKKVIALTFDDAPSEYSDEVLNILREKDVAATFFVIGKAIESYPDQLKSIVQQGHELGNHSYSHQYFLFKSQDFIKNEIETTNRLIRDAGYVGEITFRPPNGKKLFGLPWYLQQNNIKTIMWDVEPDTYFGGNSDLIKKYTLENTKPGSIILMHPFCSVECVADRESLPRIIDDLKANGYTFVTVSELLKYGNKQY